MIMVCARWGAMGGMGAWGKEKGAEGTEKAAMAGAAPVPRGLGFV